MYNILSDNFYYGYFYFGYYYPKSFCCL